MTTDHSFESNFVRGFYVAKIRETMGHKRDLLLCKRQSSAVN